MTTQQRPAPPRAIQTPAQQQAAWDEAAAGLVMMSIEELANVRTRECILIGGGDKVGKTTACISLVRFVNDFGAPGTRIFVIDTEYGWPKGVQTKRFKGKLRNMYYYRCSSIEQELEALDRIRYGTIGDRDVPAHLQHGPIKDGDWIIIESMESLWAHAQDLGYQRVTGKKKSEYLGRDPQTGKKLTSVITPSPDQLWNVVKNAHDTRFVEVLTLTLVTVNVLMTTKKAKPRAEGGFMKENRDRAAFKAESGIEAGFEGAPRLPYAPDTVLYFEKENNIVSCAVLGDRGSNTVGTRFPMTSPWEWPYRFFWWYRDEMPDDEYAVALDTVREG